MLTLLSISLLSIIQMIDIALAWH